MGTRKQLNRTGYMINRKKVRRLMGENNLLNHSYNRIGPVKRVVNSIVVAGLPDQVWEFDIKYVWIHGEEILHCVAYELCSIVASHAHC